MRVLAASLFVAGVFLTTGLSFAQPPGGDKGKGGPGGDRGKGGPGDKGGFGRGGMGGGPGQILPPFLADQLKLTDAQKKEVDDLQKDVQAKLDQILTADQKKQLADLKEKGFGRGGPGGPGGRGPGGPGGPGGRPGQPGGNPPPKKD